MFPPFLKLSGLLILLLFCSSTFSAWYQDSAEIMGTRINVELWSKDHNLAQDAIKQVMAEMQRINDLMSPWLESSELYQVNQQAAVKPLLISNELFNLIAKSLYFSRVSDGAFDITFSSLGKHFDYRKAQQPSQKQVHELLPSINYQLIELNKTTRSIYFKNAKVQIDLGGIAKGHAVDGAINILQKLKIQAAMVSAGGDSRIIGSRGDRPWHIGVKHPRKSDEYAVMIPLENTAISTSGDYERFFMDGDKRIHHILNPKTGQSSEGVQSVSILTKYAVDSDALSTTVFVMGVKPGLALVNNMPGVDAIIIDGQGKLHYSDELLLGR